MKIYRDNTEIYDIRPEDGSTQRVVHMGEDVLNLIFRITSALDLRVNDYVYFQDKKYKLKRLVNPRKISRYEFEYICQLFSPQYDFQDALYLLSDSSGVGELDDTIPLFGTLTFHANQIVRCVKEVHPGWVVGPVDDTWEGRNVTYTDMDCLEAVQHLADEFGCEYWFTGNAVCFGKRSEGNPILFKYGKGNSLYELSRQNQDGRIVTKLRVQGSNRNIDPATYGSPVLRLPGGGKYVTKNTEKYGVIMGRQRFDEVFPRLIHKNESDPGIVTSVRVVNGIYYIKDSNLNFNPGDYLLPGLSIKVVFQTGQLGGLKIEANWNSSTQEYELIRNDYGLGMDVPASVFIPAVGDLYLLEDIRMPESYVLDAELELEERSLDAIAQVSEQKVSYKGPVNPLYFRQLGEHLETGRAVIVEDSDIVDGGSVELRIQAFTRPVNNTYNLDIEISDTLYVSRISKMENSIRETKNTEERNNNQGLAFSRRNWRDVQETRRDMYDPEGNFFTNAITPLTVQLMQLIAGSESLQFVFLEPDWTTETIPAFNFNTNTRQFTAPLSRIKHMTLGIDSVSASHEANAYKYWEIEPYTSSGLVPENSYYLYAKCSKLGLAGNDGLWKGAGTFVLSSEIIALNADPDYYHFWVLHLNSEFDGDRNWNTMYGFTEILPGQILTNLIKSVDGKTYFDLLQGIIAGNIKFISPDGDYTDLGTAISDLNTDIENIDVGGVNLILNSGFTGNFESLELTAETKLTADTQLFSNPLKHWSGDAKVHADSESASGYSCSVSGRIEQTFFPPLISGERYVLSFRLKGSVSVKIGMDSVERSAAGNYERIVFKFEARQAAKIEFIGNCTICEIQLERGTVATAWSLSPNDNDRAMAKFESIRYLSDAIKGQTRILGGLVLTSMIQLGVYRNKEIEKITAGMSGIYNDGDDVAFWAGGRLEDAIRTSMRPFEKTGANAVITHGGRAIFNEAVIRGVVYAERGVFKGRIEAEEGFFRGRVESNKDGNRIIIDPDDEERKLKFVDRNGKEVGYIDFFSENEDNTLSRIVLYNLDDSGEIKSTISISPESIQMYNTDGSGYVAIGLLPDGIADLRFSNLPTSGTGLGSGRLYRSGNDLRIV